MNVANRLGWRVECGGVNKDVGATTFGAVSTGTWMLVVAYHDAASDLLGISVNAGAFDTVATAGGAPAKDGPFQIGKLGGRGLYFDGRVAMVGLWKNRVLSADDVTALYNAGAGLAFAELT